MRNIFGLKYYFFAVISLSAFFPVVVTTVMHKMTARATSCF